MSGILLGRRVLELVTDNSGIRTGLTEARADVLRQTQQISNDAKIKYQADLQALKTANQQILVDARSTARQAEIAARYKATIDTAQYKADLKTLENEQKASLQRMRQQAQESGGGISGLGGDLLTGLGIGSGAAAVQTGIQAITGAVSLGKSAFIDYNSAIDDTRAQLLSFTRSNFETERILKDLRTEADKTPFTFAQISGSIATLIPVSKQSGESLNDLIKLAETLAALNPEQGFQGATIAIANAVAGQTQSLQERFNISREAITRFKEQGLSDLDAVRAALKAMGVDESVVGNLSQTFNGQLSTLTDTLTSLANRAGGTAIFDGVKRGIGELADLVNNPALQRDAQQLGDAVADSLNRIGKALGDADVRKTLESLARVSLQESARTLRDFTDALVALSNVAKPFGAARDLIVEPIREITDGIDKLNGKGHVVQDFLNAVQDQNNPISKISKDVNELADAFHHLNEEEERRQKLAHAPGQNTGPGSFPLAGPSPAAGVNPGNASGPQTGSSLPVPPQQTGNLDPEFDPGKGSALPATIPPGQIPAVPPPTQDPTPGEDFNQLAARRAAQRYQQLYNQGQADFQAFTRGFTSQDFDIYDKLKPQVDSTFQRLFGSLSQQAQFDKGGGNLDGLTARIVADLKATGSVSAETSQQIQATFGDQAHSIIELADQYGTLEAAQKRATDAANDLKSAQLDLTAAQKKAAADQQEVRDNVEALSQALADLNKEARGVAAGFAGQIDQAQAALTAAQQAQAQIQQQAQLHAAAYQAVLEGNTDEFLKQNDALDEQTRKIIENGNAQVAAALKAKTAQDSVVQGLEEKERRTQLGYDEQIRAARSKRLPNGELDPNGQREANALTEERDREIAKIEYQLQLERERAAVRGDEANAAKKPVEDAAQAQADADKKATDAAGQRVTEASQRLQDIQDQAKDAAADYAARGQAIQGNIDKEEERGRVLARVDQKAIDDAQKRVDDAAIVKQNADDELVTQGKITDALSSQNTLLDTRFKAWQTFYENVLKPAGVIMAQFQNGYPPSPPAQQGQTGTQQSPIDGSPESQPRGSDDPAPITAPGQLSRVPLPVYTPPAALSRAALPTYQPPAPPPRSLAAYSTLAGTSARASLGGGAPVSIGPFHFPNASFTSDIDVKKAMREAIQQGAELAVDVLVRAQEEDRDGGGAMSPWRT